jgi:hypothetical protein
MIKEAFTTTNDSFFSPVRSGCLNDSAADYNRKRRNDKHDPWGKMSVTGAVTKSTPRNSGI